MKQGIRKEGWATGGFPGHSGQLWVLQTVLFLDAASGFIWVLIWPAFLPTSLSFLVHELMVLLIVHLPPAAYISWFVEREDTWAANKHFGSSPPSRLLPVMDWICFGEKKKWGNWFLAMLSSLPSWSCAHQPSPASVGKTKHLSKRTGRLVDIIALQQKRWGSSPAPPQQDSGPFPSEWASDAGQLH